jgi:hypothetical protein
MKIEILKLEGRRRNGNGVVSIDGVEYKFELETDDGMTSIYLTDGDNRYNLEDDDDLEEIGIEDGYEIYDEIIYSY